MEEKTNNKKQAFMTGVMTIVIAQVVIKVLGLLYRLVITNIPQFGDTGNGLYGAGYQIYMLLLAMATVGIPGAIAKLVSERLALGKPREAHKIFKVALGLFAFIGAIGSVILFFGADYIASTLMNMPDAKGVLMALSPSIFLVSVSAVIRGYFNGMYNMKATSNSQMLEQFFKSFLTIGIVVGIYFISIAAPTALSNWFNISSENATVAMAVGANVATTLASFFSLIYVISFYNKRKKEIWKNVRDSKEEYNPIPLKKIAKMILFLSIPMSLASIISALNRNVDLFTVTSGLEAALAGFGTPEQISNEAVRLYGILSGKVDMLIGLPLALNIAFATALVPAVTEALAVGDKKTATRRISFSIRTTALIGFPCTVGLFVLAEPILKLLFSGAPAVEAPLLLQISAFTVMFSVINQTLGGSLQGVGKIFVPAISILIGATAKLIINLILIPNPAFGINGAAIGSVVCCAVTTIIEAIVLSKNIKLDLKFMQSFGKPIIASIIMGAISYITYDVSLSYLKSNAIATLISIVVAVVVYMLMLLLLKVFNRDDYHMLPYGDKIYNFLRKLKLVKP